MNSTTYTLIYRIEDARHKGAYHVQYQHLWPTLAHQPSPSLDGLGRPTSYDEHFGFESMAQLRAWFREYELHSLNAHNKGCLRAAQAPPDSSERLAYDPENLMQLVVIRIALEHVRYGGHQLTFLNAHADRILILPLDPKLIASL